jgi:dipeptidyl aminopeptidase/acylaminoacyl peptidase
MRPVIIILAFLLVGTAVFYFTRPAKLPSPSGVTPISTPAPLSLHPYAIASLMSRVNPDGKITIGNTNPGQAAFDSYTVSYSSENLKQYALMLVPTGQMPASGWPVVVVNHGHIAPRQYSTVSSYKNTSAYYAAAGFLVLKPDYRGLGNSQGTTSPFISRNQYAVDVLNLVAAVKSLPGADPGNIFLYGHSLGGDVALQTAEVSDQIKGATLWAPAVTSYPESLTYFSRRHTPSPTDSTFDQAALDRFISLYPAGQFSALDNTAKVQIPLIIQQSTTDQSVPYSWGQQLYNILKNSGKNVTFYSYPNDNHDIAGHWSQALSRDVAFFRSLIKSPAD